ncbi:MAG: hypothetical protein ACP5FR_03235, partial [Candidatus Micrarchaeia archaeon]
QNYRFTFNPANMTSGIYSSNLSFSYIYFTNSSYSKFMLGNPTNITIENFSTSASIKRYSQQQFYISIKNTGSFAAPNSISVRIATIGPYNSLFVLPLNYSLLPSQNLNITATMYNSTLFPGTYNALLNVTYAINGTGGRFLMSKYKTINYSVVQPPPVSKPLPPPSPVPYFSLISFPYIVSLQQNESYPSFITIANKGNETEYFNFSVPSQFSDMAMLMASNIVITPHSQVSESLLFASGTSRPGAYTIPLNVSSSIGNKTLSETIYIMLNICNKTSVGVFPNIYFSSGIRNITGTLVISNPTGVNLTGVIVKTILPMSIAKNASFIKAYGIPSSISTESIGYVVSWYVGSMPKYSSTYAYLSISNVSSPSLLYHISSIFSVPSAPLPSSILRIISINSPVLYVGKAASINVSALYTGTEPQKISIYVTAPPGVYVYNSTQYVNATPNMAFVRSFHILSEAAGTIMVNVYIDTEGANMSYDIPIVVFAPPSTTTTSTTTTIPQNRLPSNNSGFLEIGAISIAILMFAFLIIIGARIHGRSRYNPERAEKLKHIKEELKRSE